MDDVVGDVHHPAAEGYSLRMSPESLLECLEGLEPDFVRASQTALRMQRGVQSYNKLQTGNPAVDIVTEADLATQETILKALRSTSLIGCRLLAEEDTESVQAFAAESKFYLALDPIEAPPYTQEAANISAL